MSPRYLVLGPPLCDILFDKLLEMTMPEGVIAVAYTDDLAIVATANLMEDIKDIEGTAVGKIRSGWKVNT